jgi:integrase
MRGHVRERGPGNWYAVLSTRDQQTGKRKVHWRSLPQCRGKREAQQECARIITEMATGVFIEPAKTTVAEFLRRWLDHIQTQVQPRTARFYAEQVANLIPLIGAIPLSKLKPEQVSAAYAHALKDGRRDGKPGGLSARSVHHMHRVLTQALGQAMKWGAINRNVAALVDPPKVTRAEMHTFDVDQATAVIELARGKDIFIPILLGLMCGLRRGEICAVRWRNINLDTGQLSVVASIEEARGGMREKQPKNGKGRTVALPPMLISELRRHRLQQAEWLLRLGVRLTEDHHICMRQDGETVWPTSIARAFRTFLRNHNLPQIRFHDLRHSHASHMLASNVHPKVVQERLGHSSIGITLDTYSHVMPNMQADAAATINAAFQAALDKRGSNR